jgi:acyl-CoA reductase-like NAD-dependent aldehyde dehydrogenase
VTEVNYIDANEAASKLNVASSFQQYWASRPLNERIDALQKAVDWMLGNSETLVRETSE